MRVPKLRRLIAIVVVIALCAGTAVAEKFEHRFSQGDQFRILSKVDEDVYVNRRYSHSAQILNRIAFSVDKVREDGAGFLSGTFSTSVQYAGGQSYVADRLYESQYWHLPSGRFEIGEQYYMPVVRHVPSFPDRDLVPGDTWNAPAEERHDFRDGFGIPDPYVIPVQVRYTYQGPGQWKGKDVQLVRAEYTIFYTPSRPRSYTTAYPVQIAGYSDQLMYWDAERGGVAAYEERFRFVFDLSNGQSIEYRGQASAEVVESQLMDKGALEKRLRDAVKGLKDIGVASDDHGVTITLENIQFEPDSARLLPSELDKIRRIAEVLKAEPDRHLLISGHTAMAGTAEGRLQLSQERARAVAEALISMGVRVPEDITVIGYGAERPVADNLTELGRSRNRRVEITILEN